MPELLKIALPKGRLGERVYNMFAQAGYSCPEVLDDTRKLIFENPEAGVCYFWVKPSDVAIYVDRGAADIGVAGRDILLEYSPEVYELLDLGVGKCRLAVAGKKGFRDRTDRTLRVATKFPHVTTDYYSKLCRDIDIIGLSGSIELAPILGLSDVILDIVESGKTLAENGLEPIETVADVSARLIANRSAFRFKNDAILKLTEEIRKLV
ncbi:MAG: ATP phosphoribosyltransferase [Eubacteriales bacterium]